VTTSALGTLPGHFIASYCQNSWNSNYGRLFADHSSWFLANGANLEGRWIWWHEVWSIWALLAWSL